MPRLILLRHAKAVPQDEMDDAERPLAERGREDMPAVARYLKEHSIGCDLALVSPSQRTRETWELLIAGGKAPTHRFEPRLYLASAQNILRLVRETPADVRSLLLVGHNPGLEELGRMLTGAGDTELLMRFGGVMPTAAVAVIDVEGTWSGVEPRKGRLEYFATPKSLRARAER